MESCQEQADPEGGQQLQTFSEIIEALKTSKVEKCPFLTKWFDPLDLSNQKKLLDLGYIYPRGVRGGVALFFFGKSVFLKHPTPDGF